MSSCEGARSSPRPALCTPFDVALENDGFMKVNMLVVCETNWLGMFSKAIRMTSDNSGHLSESSRLLV